MSAGPDPFASIVAEHAAAARQVADALRVLAEPAPRQSPGDAPDSEVAPAPFPRREPVTAAAVLDDDEDFPAPRSWLTSGW